MGLPFLFAFQEPRFHLFELQLPASHLLSLLSPIAILVFSLVPAAIPELPLAPGAVVACAVNLAHTACVGPLPIAPVGCSKSGASLPAV